MKTQGSRDGGFNSNPTNDFAQEYQPPPQAQQNVESHTIKVKI